MYILSVSNITYHQLVVFISLLHKDLAYLDPGSGSFILQIILATLLASLLFMKGFWRKVLGIFKKPSSLDQDKEKDLEKKDEEGK
jgi:hypothetical protein